MRAMWKASLELGKLRIPVKLYGGVEERKIHFRLLHAKDRVPVVQRMVDPRSGEEVPGDEIRRGVELEPGVFVVVAPEEQESAQPEASRTIEVMRVVPRDALDIAWFERPYYLGPDGQSADYFALAKVLADDAQLGIARWVMRGKQYFGALEPLEDHLALIAMRSADEVVTPEALARPVGPKISASERELGEQLIAALEGHFDPSALRDEYRERIEKLIAAKRRGRRYAVKETALPRAGGDLGSALRRSLQAAKRRTPCRSVSGASAGARGAACTVARRAAARAVGRPVWSGSLSFGLVSVPVELYSAQRERALRCGCSVPRARRSRASTSARRTRRRSRPTRSCAATRSRRAASSW